MRERRIYQRTPVELAASFGMPEAEDFAKSNTVVNISQGGFCIESDKMLRIGTNIKLTVHLERKDNVTVNVRTVWNKKIGDTGKYKVGVQITNSEGPDFERFLNFYCTQLKKVHHEVK